MSDRTEQTTTPTPAPDGSDFTAYEARRLAANGASVDYDDPLGGVIPPPDPESKSAAEPPSEGVDEEKADAEPQSADDGDRQPDEEPGKKASRPKEPPGFRKRLNRQAKQIERKDAEIQALKAQLEQAQGKAEAEPKGKAQDDPTPAEEEPESQSASSEEAEDDEYEYPVREKYESDEAYALAVAEWDERMMSGEAAEEDEPPASEEKAEPPKQESEESAPQPQASDRGKLMRVYHQNLLEMLEDHDADSEFNGSHAEDFERLRLDGRIQVSETMLERMATDDEEGVEIALMFIELPRLSREVEAQSPDKQNERIDRLLEKRRNRKSGDGNPSPDAPDVPAPTPLRGKGNAPELTLREAAEGDDFAAYERLRMAQNRRGEEWGVGI